ncbi:hypothetical protein N473_22915 [Pseudoalteromonas luteoviolacea CPMOR-1]|uniref:Uncharacterized protein n=1 Tax=Pseudoalteromonas luteoviolacea CPMOR-1 TaxID=1365248 RepID=A0A167JC35_9GAMM|nr:hypothetical protein N473_22915 [Pseudoalteromonas luteoviolacea CPMOR-1]
MNNRNVIALDLAKNIIQVLTTVNKASTFSFRKVK